MALLTPRAGRALPRGLPLRRRPERVVRGAITDPDGRPVPDAAVAIADRVAITDDQGAFLLDGLPQDATGPVHVAAHGHTAWTLDRRTLDRLQARLRPSGDLQIASNTLLSLTLAFPQPLTEERTLYLAIDATQITPVRLLPGTTSHRLALPITPGARTLGLLAPPERDEQPYLWAPTALLQIPTSGAELTLAPQPIQPETITLQFTHPEPDAYSLAVTCDAPRGGSALIALGATWDRDQARLALAPAAPGSTCQIIATASPQGSGAALVAFTAFAAGAPPAALRLPPLALTEPQADDDARALSWDPIPGADAYDLFLAPPRRRRPRRALLERHHRADPASPSPRSRLSSPRASTARRSAPSSPASSPASPPASTWSATGTGPTTTATPPPPGSRSPRRSLITGAHPLDASAHLIHEDCCGQSGPGRSTFTQGPSEHSRSMSPDEDGKTMSTPAVTTSEQAPIQIDLNDPAEQLRDRVITVLCGIYDPEIPVNIYELGLVYEIDVATPQQVLIRMTLTSPACPVAGSLPGEVEEKVQTIEGIEKATVELTWEPPWEPDMMSEEARLELGFF
jgi:FeS assembly SUF system protein